MPNQRTVFLKEEKVYANLITEGAHASRVQYLYGGVMFDVFVENDEIEFIEEDEIIEE
jgi:hypothetical protein